MSSLIIAVFDNKIFLEILKEIKIFSRYSIKHYENIDTCIKDSEKQNLLAIFFDIKKIQDFFGKNKSLSFPLIVASKKSDLKINSNNELIEQLNLPFSILDFEKKIISLVAKNEFKKNSLIYLNDYIVDKNERKIKKNDLSLQLSEKEINFLILFSESKSPVSKNLVLERVWNYSPETETHTVETHIHRLRKKILQKFGDNNFIKNNNKGYYI